MSEVTYKLCDDCGKHVIEPLFTIEREAAGTLADPQNEILHACTALCLVRIANELHRKAQP